MAAAAKRTRFLKPSDALVAVLWKHIDDADAFDYTTDLDDSVDIRRLMPWTDMLLEVRAAIHP
eukprot:1937018-Pyramimonas_sp.AAC.1